MISLPNPFRISNLDSRKCPYSMNNTQIDFNSEIAPDLRDFLCNNFTDLNDAVDWVCYTFNLDATDELIDQIADEFDAFFGN